MLVVMEWTSLGLLDNLYLIITQIALGLQTSRYWELKVSICDLFYEYLSHFLFSFLNYFIKWLLLLSLNLQGKEVNLFQPAAEFLPMINEVCIWKILTWATFQYFFFIRTCYPDWLMLEQVLNSLEECTKDIKGAKVENNKFCVSVHYRNVDEKVIGFCTYNFLLSWFSFFWTFYPCYVLKYFSFLYSCLT